MKKKCIGMNPSERQWQLSTDMNNNTDQTKKKKQPTIQYGKHSRIDKQTNINWLEIEKEKSCTYSFVFFIKYLRRISSFRKRRKKKTHRYEFNALFSTTQFINSQSRQKSIYITSKTSNKYKKMFDSKLFSWMFFIWYYKYKTTKIIINFKSK